MKHKILIIEPTLIYFYNPLLLEILNTKNIIMKDNWWSVTKHFIWRSSLDKGKWIIRRKEALKISLLFQHLNMCVVGYVLLLHFIWLIRFTMKSGERLSFSRQIVSYPHWSSSINLNMSNWSKSMSISSSKLPSLE